MTRFLTSMALSILTLSSVCAQETRWSVQLDSVNVFSSPRFTDLNEDGVKDVVIGGGIENMASPNGVIALNGVDGKILWTVPAYTQIYTSALFQDIDGDGTDDVFIGGRAASLFAISGATGKIIWKFWKGTVIESREAGWMNFFSTQWLDDQNNDGFKDLLVTNGGDYLAMPNHIDRAVASLMIICGKTGETLTKAKMPENRESYYAPHIYLNKNKPMVVFGTGGETIDGKLWQVPLKSLQKGKLKKASVLISDDTKGFILNSVLADLNGDGKSDFINARMSAILTAVDGSTRKTLWEHQFEGYECYVTPSLGQFVGSATPDLFTILAKGTFPSYTAFKLIVVDGETGEIAWQEDSGFNQFSPGIALDFDNDGRDEIVYIENELIDPTNYGISNKLRVINLATNTAYYLGDERSGLAMASAPGFVDLEGNGTSEIVVATSSLDMGQGTQFSSIDCIELKESITVSNWPGYLGPEENGSYTK